MRYKEQLAELRKQVEELTSAAAAKKTTQTVAVVETIVAESADIAVAVSKHEVRSISHRILIFCLVIQADATVAPNRDNVAARGVKRKG